MVLVGSFAILYGMRMFLFLLGIPIAAGVVIALLFFGNVQPWRLGRRTELIRLRLDWAPHRDREDLRRALCVLLFLRR